MDDTTRRRGIPLTIVLTILTVASVLSFLMSALAWNRMLVLYHGGVAFLMMLIEFLRLLAIIGLWQWRKTAVVLSVSA